MSEPSRMDITPARRSVWRNLSPIWLVPLLAVVVSLGIAYNSYAQRGELIEISFDNAAGVTAGSTELRYREVSIGLVEDVAFSDDLSRVIVSARVDRAAVHALSAAAQFWVVRPQVSARGISGLGTVLSGVYIEASFDPQIQADTTRSFVGQDNAPLVRPGVAGTRVTLRAPDGNRLTPGAPILFRGIEVGHIEAPRLIDGAEGVEVDAFIEAPHDLRLTSTTRFWDTSGFSVSLGTSGLRLSVGNLASILTGGIAFDNLGDPGDPLTEDAVFDLFDSETTARETSSTVVAANQLRIAAEFDGSVQGLSTGAIVRYRGIRVGEVSGIAARLVDMGPSPLTRMQVVMGLDPNAFGLGTEATPQMLESFLESAVASGLRARLAASGVFSTNLVIELVKIEDTPPNRLFRPVGAVAVIPSAPSDVNDLTTSAQGLIERITSLPIEEVLQQAVSLMESVEVLLADEGTRAAPAAVTALMGQIGDLIGADATQALPGELQGTIAELRTLLASVQQQEVVAQLAGTMQSIQDLAVSVEGATTEVPPLISEIRRVVGQVGDLDTVDLLAAATELMSTTSTFLALEGTQSLPPALAGALGEVELALAELRNSGIVEGVNQTLLSAQSAAESIATATEILPPLAERLNGLVAQAEQLVAAYGDRSPVNQEAINTLREARDAARAFAELARTLERSPNSILFGR